MKKTVLLTESQLKTIKESLEKESELSNKLRPFIFKQVKKHMTSLGDNEAFPPEEDFPFDYKVLKDRFSEIIENIKSIEGLESFDETYLSNRLSQLVKECKEIEEPIIPNLEKICANVVIQLFDIPNDTVNFSAEIVNEVTPEHQFRVKPEPSAKRKFDFEDLNDFKDANKAVLKRRMINSLIQGASYMYANDKNFFLNDLYQIDKRLIDLYSEITAINDYLLFTKEEKITDKTPMQGGCVEVSLGANKDKTTIKAQGIIFPFALAELIRGFLELFASHGLPKDNNKAKYIINQADFLIAEPWDLRMGVNLWKYIAEYIEDTKVLPYFFMNLCSLPIEEFNSTLQEVFAKTNKGKHLLKHLYLNAEDDMQSQRFISTIDAKNAQIALIADNVMGIDEINEKLYESLLQENEEDEAEYDLNADEKGEYPFDYQSDEDWAKIDSNEEKLLRQIAKRRDITDPDELKDFLHKKKRADGLVSASEEHWKNDKPPMHDIIKQRMLDKNDGRAIYTKDDLKRHLDFDTDTLTPISKKSNGNVKKRIETNFDATKIGRLFAHGNTKLSNDILVVNLTSAKNCPAAKLGHCAIYNAQQVARKRGETASIQCYAQKSEHRKPDVIANNLRAEITATLLSTEEFIKLLEEHIERFDFVTKYIRFNESGDFPSQEFVERCDKAAEYMYKNYGILSSAYTCRVDLDFSNCNYLIINGSQPTIKGMDRYYQACSQEKFDALEDNQHGVSYDENGKPYFKCHCNCKQCHFCYHTRGQNGEDPGKMTTVYCAYH